MPTFAVRQDSVLAAPIGDSFGASRPQFALQQEAT